MSDEASATEGPAVLAGRVRSALESGDLDAIRDLLDPDARWGAPDGPSDYYCRSEERHESQRRQLPEDKYAFIMYKDTDLVHRVRNADMASYLGVSLRTYAKIRKDFAEGWIPPYNGAI